MKFILGTLLILSSMVLASESFPNQKLLAGTVPDAQKIKDRSDSRIQPPNPRKYQDVQDGNNWLNPYLVIRPEGIEVIWKISSVERKVILKDDLKKVLISLPVAAWPYGRIVGVQEVGIRNGFLNSEVWRKDEKLIEKNKLAVNKVLTSLDIQIKWWPSN